MNRVLGAALLLLVPFAWSRGATPAISGPFSVHEANDPSHDQHAPIVAFDGTDYLVAWTEPGFRNRYARVTPEGTLFDPACVTITDTDANYMGIAYGGGAYLLAWPVPTGVASVRQPARRDPRPWGLHARRPTELDHPTEDRLQRVGLLGRVPLHVVLEHGGCPMGGSLHRVRANRTANSGWAR